MTFAPTAGLANGNLWGQHGWTDPAQGNGDPLVSNGTIISQLTPGQSDAVVNITAVAKVANITLSATVNAATFPPGFSTDQQFTVGYPGATFIVLDVSQVYHNATHNEWFLEAIDDAGIDANHTLGFIAGGTTHNCSMQCVGGNATLFFDGVAKFSTPLRNPTTIDNWVLYANQNASNPANLTTWSALTITQD